MISKTAVRKIAVSSSTPNLSVCGQLQFKLLEKRRGRHRASSATYLLDFTAGRGLTCIPPDHLLHFMKQGFQLRDERCSRRNAGLRDKRTEYVE